MQMVDCICIGDAIVDLLVKLPEKSDHYSVDEEKKTLSLLLGEKNPVESSSFSIGGNATHVAIGLSRLGKSIALGVEIGTDEFATKILKDLDTEHISKQLLVQTPGQKSTFTVGVSLDGMDRVIFVSHVKRNHNIPLENCSTPWVFLTSLGEEWEALYKKTVAFCRETKARLAFNPGSTQLKKGTASFQEVLAACDILFVNKEEAEEVLYGQVLSPEKKESPESLLFRLQRAGPKMVVLTDGENGAYAIDGESKIFMQKPFAVTVTEKTGAGDAFSAGFLAGVMDGKNVQEALQWGAADAAGVITKIGGQEGLLTRKELEDMIQKHQ